jgi:hypothetical protein
MIMKLLVQEFLETHSFKDLQEQHGVYASFSKSGHKFSLNYDQIEAKEADPLAQECRGLILSAEDGRVFTPVESEGKMKFDHITPGVTKILAFPMRRFFNYGQGSAAEVNWADPNLAILEKLDGTLCIVYYDWITKEWCVATRSVPEADIIMDNGLFTFRTLFEKALKDTTGMDFFDFCSGNLSPNFTYCFELTTPYNRIVVNYVDNKVTLLSARHMPDLQELDFNNTRLSYLAKIIPIVQAHTYTSVSDLLDWVSSLNPMEHEGVVVRDSNFNRIKVKNAAYVAHNKLRDTLGTSERNCLELILLEKDDDVVSMLPEEIVKNLNKIKQNLKVSINIYDKMYDVVLNAAELSKLVSEGKLESAGNEKVDVDKKTFALTLQHIAADSKLWTAPFFQRFSGRNSGMRDFINQNKKDGTWSDAFLDKILEITKSYDI